MVLRRLFGRGRGFRERSADLARLFEARGVRAVAAERARSGRWSADERVVAAVDIAVAPIAEAVAVELVGRGMMRGGPRMAGLHATVPRDRIGVGWPAGWTSGIVRSRRIYPSGGLGAARDVEWDAAEDGGPAAKDAAGRLAQSAALHDRLLGLLRDAAVVECRFEPVGDTVRASVYRVAEMPMAADADFLLLCGRVLAEGEGFEPPGRR